MNIVRLDQSVLTDELIGVARLDIHDERITSGREVYQHPSNSSSLTSLPWTQVCLNAVLDLDTLVKNIKAYKWKRKRHAAAEGECSCANRCHEPNVWEKGDVVGGGVE